MPSIAFPHPARRSGWLSAVFALSVSLSAPTPVAAALQYSDSAAAYPALQLRGFTDFDYRTSDGPSGSEGFNLGQFVLHAVSPLARKVNFFGEITVLPKSNGYVIEVERSIIRYDYNDALKLSVGRYHTPIGYWNTAYHHGLWLQTTTSRPEQVRFGTEFVPVHFVGVLAEGNIPSGATGLGYSVGLGNGRSEILSRAGDAGDPNTNRAWIAQLVARPGHVDGFRLGASVYRDRLEKPGGPDVREWIASGFAALTRESPELIVEGITVHHEDALGQTFDSRAYYAQVAYRLPGAAEKFKPYVRYERMDVAEADPVFAMPDIEVVLGGVRVDLIELAALKVEYRNDRSATSGRANTLVAQASLTF